MGARKDMSISEINSEKKFNSSLSLYEIDLGEQDNISKKIYWCHSRSLRMDWCG
jgi:hypothetical protein